MHRRTFTSESAARRRGERAGLPRIAKRDRRAGTDAVFERSERALGRVLARITHVRCRFAARRARCSGDARSRLSVRAALAASRDTLEKAAPGWIPSGRAFGDAISAAVVG